MAAFVIVEASEAAHVRHCRELFEEYQRGTGVSLCFQGFDRELASLPGDYAPPAGRLFLALAGEDPVGCVGLRGLPGGVGEMKRLYVRRAARGTGLGEALARRVIDAARAAGYHALKLDTLPDMDSAQALYTRLGFRDTAPYNDNPVAGVRFMALDLGGGTCSELP